MWGAAESREATHPPLFQETEPPRPAYHPVTMDAGFFKLSPRLLAAAVVFLLTAGHSPPAESRPPADAAFLRGMTVSCPGYGRIWGSPAMEQSLAELSSLGVGWVAIHPYAGVRRDGSVHYQAAADTGYLERATGLARRQGIELFWKPHLAYWGSFDWRGDISFNDQASWRRFFDGYRAFIVDQARFAERWRIPLFAVGLEYEKTTHREYVTPEGGRRNEWRRIIADVRRVYSGRITYSANWSDIDRVTFWDAVDLIGVQAYFPLSHEPYPTAAAIRRGWDGPLDKLRGLSRRYGKPVLFAEIGYDVSSAAAREPWRGERHDTPANRDLQRRLVEVALERLEREPFIAGMFWWKWMPGSRHRGDFSMRHPGVMDIVRRAWHDAPRISAE